MRTQIWIIAIAFAVFGAIAWAITSWSPSYLGLIFLGVIMFVLGWLSSK